MSTCGALNCTDAPRLTGCPARISHFRVHFQSQRIVPIGTPEQHPTVRTCKLRLSSSSARLCSQVVVLRGNAVQLSVAAVPAGLLLLVVQPEVYDPSRAAWVVPVMVLFHLDGVGHHALPACGCDCSRRNSGYGLHRHPPSGRGGVLVDAGSTSRRGAFVRSGVGCGSADDRKVAPPR